MIYASQAHVFPYVADGTHTGGACPCQQSFVYPHVFIGILLCLHSVEADIRQPMKPNGKDIGIWFSNLLVVDRDYVHDFFVVHGLFSQIFQNGMVLGSVVALKLLDADNSMPRRTTPWQHLLFCVSFVLYLWDRC